MPFPSRFRARLTGTLAAVAMTAGLLVTTATPASAVEQKCNYDGFSFNACLTIDYVGNSRWNVLVGFDRYMPKQYADEIIACPGSGFFFSQLWGDDGGHPHDDFLGDIPRLPGWPRSGTNPEGIFAEFFREAMSLNEDDGRDEVCAARVSG